MRIENGTAYDDSTGKMVPFDTFAIVNDGLDTEAEAVACTLMFQNNADKVVAEMHCHIADIAGMDSVQINIDTGDALETYTITQDDIVAKLLVDGAIDFIPKSDIAVVAIAS